MIEPNKRPDHIEYALIKMHTNCRFITVHVTNSTDLQEIEDEVIAKDFNAQQKSGEILSWSGMCMPLEFKFELEEEKEKEIKKEEINA